MTLYMRWGLLVYILRVLPTICFTTKPFVLFSLFWPFLLLLRRVSEGTSVFSREGKECLDRCVQYQGMSGYTALIARRLFFLLETIL